VIVYDRLNTTSGQIVFQLVSPVSPPTATGTSHTFTTKTHTLTVEDVLTPPGTTPSIFNFKQSDSTEFPNGGFRLDETAGGGSDNRFLHVLTIDNAATNIMLANTTDRTKDIVSFMAGGQPVTMAFNHSDIGGTLTIAGQMHTLGAGLEPRPE
jgi:hypothetical protein